ncbi:hypothetical protein AB3N04_12920 [Alkalihalophilus sp. As8PL]|uniref:Uncharacterized protein n=1 Tax=Alkalihalophilus sp. As8PL TaxID=3237103 RepID=A0AB39BPF2_9BACI
MKHLHIWKNDKFTEPYIQLINKHFDQSEHSFLIIHKGSGVPITSSENVRGILKNINGIIRIIIEMYRSNKIYLHSLFDLKVVIILFFQPWLLKKSNWII